MLATDVRNMNNRLLALEAERIKVRSSIMLGQLAYAIDDAATLYVFGSGQGHPTVRDIEKDAEAGDLTDEVQERWTEFKSFLHRKNWDVGRFKRYTKPLRIVWTDTAHGTPEEQASMTSENLQQWATAKLGQRIASRG